MPQEAEIFHYFKIKYGYSYSFSSLKRFGVLTVRPAKSEKKKSESLLQIDVFLDFLLKCKHTGTVCLV